MQTVLRLLTLATLLTCAVPVRAGEPPSTTPTTLPTWKRQQDIIYGRTAGTALTLDVFTPREKPNGAAVIIVVSGGWFSAHEVLDSPMISIFIGPFIQHGYILFGVVPASQPKFTINEIAENVDRSVKFIRANSARFEIDGGKIAITGGSAGGHLSLLQATKPSPGKRLSLDAIERASGRVQAAAVLFPPTDFLNYRGEGKNIMDDPALDPFAAAFDFHEINDAQHKLVPVSRRRHTEILRELSPAQHISKDTPPCLIIHGDKDELVPMQQATLFLDKLKAQGVPAELVVKKGAGHGWGNAEVDIELMAQFFDKNLLGRATTKESQ
jgi:acetyl esterase/lipase